MKITICGIAELDEHCESGISHVLSILDPGWPDPAAFDDFSPHHRVALRFHDIIAPVSGEILPTADHVAALLDYGRAVIAAGPNAHVLIHCHAGVSRSTAAAALLLAQADPARPPADIFATIGRIRPRAWPNLLILEHGEAALGRPGEIVPAVAAQYRRVLSANPAFASYIRDVGRGREVALAGYQR
ncbi:MAG TPA: protein-tyrosine-phosphatase [Stellaceae bacterium]|nr:protein-tyrosine-phosphatase [Stellaceae bacterium]